MIKAQVFLPSMVAMGLLLSSGVNSQVQTPLRDQETASPSTSENVKTVFGSTLPGYLKTAPPKSLDDVKKLETHIQNLLEKIRPATVSVSGGTGVVISKEGLILTAGTCQSRTGATSPDYFSRWTAGARNHLGWLRRHRWRNDEDHRRGLLSLC